MKKLIAITGASSGIGRQTAIRLSKEGHPLLLIARRDEMLKELNLPNSICAKVDVCDLQEFKSAVQKAQLVYGKVDCMINCAGIMLLGKADSQNPSEWKKMIDVNITGVLNGIHCVLSDMMKRKEGTIINISSIAGRKTFPDHSVYCATKFAVHAMTENMREGASSNNVRFITIAPGVVETNLLEHTTNERIKEDYKDWKKSIESGLDPNSVSSAILYAYNQPQDVCIREIVLAKTTQNA